MGPDQLVLKSKHGSAKPAGFMWFLAIGFLWMALNTLDKGADFGRRQDILEALLTYQQRAAVFVAIALMFAVLGWRVRAMNSGPANIVMTKDYIWTALLWGHATIPWSRIVAIEEKPWMAGKSWLILKQKRGKNVVIHPDDMNVSRAEILNFIRAQRPDIDVKEASSSNRKNYTYKLFGWMMLFYVVYRFAPIIWQRLL
jgi:hypothetical protein